MSVGYTGVQWNRHKRVYDAVAVAAVVLFIAAFILASRLAWSAEHAPSEEVLLIRSLGACAAVLLHVILCIGPLARLDRRFLPVLYNRRHLGVLTFLIALAHGLLSLGYYHGFGVVSPLRSLLAGNNSFTSLSAFPFQLLGLGTLLVMFLMAATSHDFWLKNLSPASWKRLHMLIYPAYALLVGHIALGALQTSRGPLAPALAAVGLALILSLHLAAGLREVRRDRRDPASRDEPGEWIDVGAPADIPIDRARTVCAPGGERIAVFRHDGKVSAVTNLCAHQGGPLGEGKVIDGCITCPWHGWQYRPNDGCSPPPFKEEVATYQVRIVAGRVQVNARALPPGTPTVPVAEASHA